MCIRDSVRTVLMGKVNQELVEALNEHGNFAVGVSGADAGVIVAEQASPDLGRVGRITRINRPLLDDLVNADYIPCLLYTSIPRWNARGAALVTIATELLVCVMLTASARKYLDIKQYVSDSLPYLGIGVLMCISVKVLARVLSIGKVSPPLLLVLEIIFGLIVFGALLAVLARHSTSHRAIIGSLIKK